PSFVYRRSIRIAPPLWLVGASFPSADIASCTGRKTRALPVGPGTLLDVPLRPALFRGAVGLVGRCRPPGHAKPWLALSLRPRRSGVASLFWEASGEHLVRSAPDPES